MSSSFKNLFLRVSGLYTLDAKLRRYPAQRWNRLMSGRSIGSYLNQSESIKLAPNLRPTKLTIMQSLNRDLNKKKLMKN